MSELRERERDGQRGKDNEVKIIVIKPIGEIDTGVVAFPSKMRQSVIWILNVPCGNCAVLCLRSFGVLIHS